MIVFDQPGRAVRHQTSAVRASVGSICVKRVPCLNPTPARSADGVLQGVVSWNS